MFIQYHVLFLLYKQLYLLIDSHIKINFKKVFLLLNEKQF